jgi:hypothetical protein
MNFHVHEQRGNLIVLMFLLMISGYQDTLILGKLHWKLALTVGRKVINTLLLLLSSRRHFSSLFAEVTMYWLMMTWSLWFLLVDDVPVLRLLFNRHVWSFFLHDHPAVCALLAEHLKL